MRKPRISLSQTLHFSLNCRCSLSGAEVTVAVTPNGYADALSEDKRLFVMPNEETMSVDHFLGTYTVTQDLIRMDICY